MSNEIDAKIARAKEALGQFGYGYTDVSAREFYVWMTAEIFSADTTTFRDVLGNEYLMIHELVEISKLKRMGRSIDKRVIVNSPRTMIYDAHLAAMEMELKYVLNKGDTYWAKIRLRQHKESVLDDDPNVPEELRPRATKIFKKYRELAEQASEQPVNL